MATLTQHPTTIASEITLRDHFAAHVLTGVVAADTTFAAVHDSTGYSKLAETIYKVADAMLAARKAVQG